MLRAAIAGRSAVRACLVAGALVAGTGGAGAQQYFNGSQTTPNGAINGGGGVWNATTTNWTNDTGTVSSVYDQNSIGTVFGSSGLSTPATGGMVTVAPGGVQLTGIVAFDVTGDNSIYTIQGGDLTLAPGGGTVFFVNDVTGTPDPSAVIASRIVGNEALSVQGSGTLALTGANTYTGGTFICSCGSLQLGDATHTASIIGDVTNEGSFTIVNANTSGITSITNDGSFGPATTTFLNATTASSIAINNVNGGETIFGTPGALGGVDTATAGNATIINDFGGTIFLARTTAGSATITNQNSGGVIFVDQSSAGSATIVNQNFGFTTFGQPLGTDTPTAGNATIINQADGLTEFGAFATAGNATIITNDGGETDFFDNSTGGNARFITNGTGIVDFGGSVGPNGDGRITAGSIEGSGTYFIGGGNTLVVGGNNRSTEVSGTIADSCSCSPGSGSLEKVGSGTLILSGTNTYTGTTTVNGGVLRVDGSISSSSLITVNAGGALYGAGIVGNTMIAGGGIFVPGDGGPGSSMQVSGNLAFQSGALYIVQVGSGTTASFANVLGDVALDGTVGVALYPGSTVLPQYSIMQFSGTASSNFSGVAAPGGLVGTTTVGPGVVYLNFGLDWGSKYNLDVNQRNVATTLESFFNANGGIPAAFAGLGPNGLTQASGEPATGSQQTTFNAMNLFLSLLTDPFAAGRGFGGNAGATPFAETDQASSYAAARKPRGKQERDAYAMITKAVPSNDLMNPRWSVWAAGFGGSQTTDGSLTLGSATVTSRVIGTAVGVDYWLSPRTIAGFALAGGGTSFSLANALGGGRSDLFQAGAFVRHTAGNAYVTGALAYGWQDVTTDRTVTAAGVDRLRAEFHANTFSGRLEGGYRYATPWMGIAPYVAAQVTAINLPAYAEAVVSGANTFAATYAARSVTDTRSELGVRTDKSFARTDGVVTLRGRLAWAHDFNPDRNVSAVFQTLPGTAFVVNGAAPSRDSALTTASAEMKWLNGWSAVATFEGEFSSVTRSYAGKGVARYTW